MLLSGLVLSLQYKPVQSYFGKRAARFLSKELKADIRIESLYFKPFSSLQLQKLYVSDQQGDTLFYAGSLEARVDLAHLFQNQVRVNRVRLQESDLRLVVNEQGKKNLQFLIDYFSPERPRADRQKVQLDLERIDLVNLSFRYHHLKDDKPDSLTQSLPHIDFKDLHLSEIYGSLTGIDFSSNKIAAQIQNLRFKEQSGFELQELTAKGYYSSNEIELANLILRTNKSAINDYLHFGFNDLKDFNDFIRKVKLNIHLTESRIVSSDIAYFAPELHELYFDAALTGVFTGTVSDLRGQNITLATSPHTVLQGSLSMRGLPDIQKTVFDIDVNHLTSNIIEIENLVPQLSEREVFDLPALLDGFGDMTFRGQFNGLYHDFKVLGDLHTALGKIETDVSIRLANGKTYYEGELVSERFELGQFVQTATLGGTAIIASVKGQGFEPSNRSMDLRIRAPYLEFQQYTYNNLNFGGSLIGNMLSGDLEVIDQHLRFDLSGSASVNPDSIIHDLYGNVHYADLRKTNLLKQDSILIHTAELTSSLQGSSFNDVVGEVTLHNVSFEHQTVPGRKHLETLSIHANGPQQQRQLALSSDVLNAQLEGYIDVYTVDQYFKGIAKHYLPSLNLTLDDRSQQAFSLAVQIKDVKLVSEFFSPQFYIAPNSAASGYFFSEPTNVPTLSRPVFTQLEVSVPELRLQDVIAKQIQLSQYGNERNAQLELNIDTVTLFGKYDLPHFAVRQDIADNNVNYAIKWVDSLKQNAGDLSGIFAFLPNKEYHLYTHTAKVAINGANWEIQDGFALFESNGVIAIDELIITNGEQRISAGGRISRSPLDELKLSFSRFDVATINPFIPNFNFAFSGQLNGNTSLRTLLEKPYATADLKLDQLALDDYKLGDLDINADFDPERNRINVALALEKQQKQQLFVGGVYNLGQSDDNLDLLARFDETELGVLEVLLQNLISNVQGSLTGQATISGNLSKLIINGNGKLNDARFTVNYLQTPYRSNGSLSMKNTVFELADFLLQDPQGQQARVTAKIDMQKPTEPIISATINTNNFLVLNTRLADNPLYFGTAYGTGRFQFEGIPSDMSIVINARTEENTTFNIPLNTAASLGSYEFIRFKKFTAGEESSDTVVAITRPSGLRLQMDLVMTPAALTNIQTDLGELSGRGEGQIALRMSSAGDFEMFGDYNINNGKFTFTAQDFINKIFEIKQGGSIRWSGKPTDATIGLTAYYEQRTSLSPLYNAAGRTVNEQRVIARAEMDLNGNLMRPNISFNLDFPSAPYVKDELQGYLSDANNINQQALSLIVRRSFSPGSTTDLSRELNSTLLNAGTELAFNQLNNIISQSLNLNFIDLNIRSLNDASASLRFFNDRLQFTGGITDLRQQQLNDWNVFRREGIATDAELLYLIRKDGRLVLRGSNRLNTRRFLLTPTDEYISALGLIYRREFDTLEEFFRAKKR